MFLPHGFQCIVGIHHGVNQIIHNDEPTGLATVLGKRVPRINQHRQMMVPEMKRITMKTNKIFRIRILYEAQS